MKASLIFYPNESKKNQRSGKIPLYMRVCFDRKKSESRLNADVTLEQLSRWDPITMRFQERNSAINQYLNRLDQKFLDLIVIEATTLPRYNATLIKDHILGVERKKTKTIIDFIDDYFNKSVLDNVNRTSGTVKNYRRAINHMVKYLECRNARTHAIEQIDYLFATDFYSYLTNTNTARIGMTEVSAAGIIKKFRTIFNHAVDAGYLAKNPFKQIKIKTKSPKRDRLTIDQVGQIVNLDLSFYPKQELYRNIFLFSVYTGLAYQDLMDLKDINLEKRANSEIKLHLKRIKTDILMESFLPDRAIDIVKLYANHPECEISGTVLPRRSNKEVNSQLKFLAYLAKIPITLSTHIGRHTFRQLLAEAGIEDYGVIKRMMGQSRHGDVDDVYYSITENRLLDAKQKLNFFINRALKLED